MFDETKETKPKKNALFDAYQTDKSMEEDGAWVELRGGIQVRIRSEQSSTAREYATKLTKQQRQILQANGWVLPTNLQDRNEVLMCKNALVVDWKGVVDEDGEELKCTPANVERICTVLPRFRSDILQAARLDETYKSVKEDLAGN